MWSDDTEAAAPGEVVFVGRASAKSQADTVSIGSGRSRLQFGREPALGRAIMAIASRYAPEQHIYVAAEDVGPRRLQALLRLFWSDARRESYFAVLGFVVDPATSGQQLFDALSARSLKTLLARRGGETPLGLRVLDDTGTLIHGDPVPFTQVAAATLPMLFYPVDRVQSRLSGAVTARPWRIEVSAAQQRWRA